MRWLDRSKWFLSGVRSRPESRYRRAAKRGSAPPKFCQPRQSSPASTPYTPRYRPTDRPISAPFRARYSHFASLLSQRAQQNHVGRSRYFV
ncbi:Uncharacterised protein [Vibrio cholerae]|nr:Uncharacterised protein [Vibrio cholerae]